MHWLPRHQGLPEQLPRDPQGSQDLGSVRQVHRLRADRLQEGRPQAPFHARHRRFAERAGHGRSGRVLFGTSWRRARGDTQDRECSRRRTDPEGCLRLLPRRQLRQAHRSELPQDRRPAFGLPLRRAQVLHGRGQQRGRSLQRRDKLMAPAGDFTSLQAALDNGADSIYFGVEQLNMRARASMNFTILDLPEISRRCKEKGVRTYLTLNTIIYDHDLSIIKTLLDKAKEADLTAVIAMDQAVIAYARQIGMEVHISTQINITNIETVKFYALFADTMVMSRELSITQIKKICSQIEKEQIKGPSGNLVEIEIFGHGALCMAVSGKCYLSLHSHNSSANRGACKQNCRKKYTVIDQESGFEIELDNEYMMSPKDLCTIGFLDQIVDAGVKVLKIEGRGRAPEYVATVTKCYREAIDSIADGTFSAEKVEGWMKQLETVYNRGFWSGYYLGQELGEWSPNSGSSATQKKIYIGKGRHFYPKSNIAEFLIEAYDLNVGDKVLIQGPTTGSQEIVIEHMMVDGKEGATKASKSDVVTFKTEFRVRPSDKLYKIVKVEEPGTQQNNVDEGTYSH